MDWIEWQSGVCPFPPFSKRRVEARLRDGSTIRDTPICLGWIHHGWHDDVIAYREITMNRDFYNKPLQGGGRDSYDYGRSGFIEPEHDDSKWFPFGFWIIVLGMATVAGLFIHWLSVTLLTVVR